jgi:hypothetical protein
LVVEVQVVLTLLQHNKDRMVRIVLLWDSRLLVEVEVAEEMIAPIQVQEEMEVLVVVVVVHKLVFLLTGTLVQAYLGRETAGV